MIIFLIIVDLFILVISTGVAFFFVVMLLTNSSDSLGFENAKITDAKVIRYQGFTETDSDINIRITTYDPIIGFFNEYKNQYEEKKIYGAPINPPKEYTDRYVNSGSVVEDGGTVKIQYTPSRARIIDERFVKPNHYSLMRFIIPLTIGAFIALNSFIFLVILILIQG